MQTKITDIELLKKIKPERLQKYLEMAGWDGQEQNDRGACLYQKKDRGILWLANDKFLDYGQRMQEAVATIAETDDMSQLEVVTRLLGTDLGNKYKFVRENDKFRISFVAHK